MRACWRRISAAIFPGKPGDHRQEHGRRLGRAGGGLHHRASRRRTAPRSACSSTASRSARFWAGPATSIRSSSSGSAASPRPRPSPWSGTPRRRRSVDDAKSKEIIVAASVPGTSIVDHPARAQRPHRHQIQGHPRLPGLAAAMALAMERGEVHAIGGHGLGSDPDHQAGLADREEDHACSTPTGRGASPTCRTLRRVVEFAVDDNARSILRLVGVRPRDRPLDRRRSRGIPPERAAALRRAFMETMADHGLRRRHAQAQPRHRAIDRRGAADRSSRPRWQRRASWWSRSSATSEAPKHDHRLAHPRAFAARAGQSVLEAANARRPSTMCCACTTRSASISA